MTPVAIAGSSGGSFFSAYNHWGVIESKYTDWMRGLPASATLDSISLPGTHDSGTYPAGANQITFSDLVQTQSLNIYQQLLSGIRAFDIRVNRVTTLDCEGSSGQCVRPPCYGGDLYIFHGDVCLDLTFASVLHDFDNYLSRHPTETIVMRVQDESGNPSNASTFLTLVAQTIRANVAADHIYQPSLTIPFANCASVSQAFGYLNCPNLNPPLGPLTNPASTDARDKLVVFEKPSGRISNLTACSATTVPICGYIGYVGIPYNGVFKAEQDQFNWQDYTQLSSKWRAVHDFFVSANGNVSTYFFNFLSASGGYFSPRPYFWAGGVKSPDGNAPLKKTEWARGSLCATADGGCCSRSPICLDEYPSSTTQNCKVYCDVYYPGINELAANWLVANPSIDRVGLVFADFPGAALIRAIIDVNLQCRATPSPC